MNNHYEFLDTNFLKFVSMLPVSDHWKSACTGCIVADGDKCYGYRAEWESAGVPFNHGVAIYLISKMSPYVGTVRDTEDGWVDVGEWVIRQYHQCGMKEILECI